MGDEARIRLAVDAADATADELDRMSRELRQALLDVDEVVSADLAGAEPPPPEAKGIDPALASSLLVSVMSGGVASLIAILRDWHRHRHPRATVRLEGPNGAVIEYPGVDEAEIARILQRWATVDLDGTSGSEPS